MESRIGHRERDGESYRTYREGERESRIERIEREKGRVVRILSSCVPLSSDWNKRLEHIYNIILSSYIICRPSY
jgi:hypothetical protein